MHNWIIRLNNWWAFFRKKTTTPEETLLLVPHCLQHKGCNRDVMLDIMNCARCGNCKMGELAKIHEQHKLRVVVANGGRQACEAVRKKNVRAVVAVACEKELSAGILATRPKRVVAVRNLQPNGPCRNTDVQMDLVEQALQKVWTS